MEAKESSVKTTLRNLCLSYGCSYGVFWRFDPRNYMLLTVEDAYYEEHAGIIVDTMCLQSHILGEGRIGKAAIDGKHRWISVNSPTKEQNVIWDDSDLSLQFLAGIKTIVVVPLEIRGVVQFGFTKEIMETPEFLHQARKFLLDNDTCTGVSSAGNSSLNSNVDIQNGLLVSSISSESSFHVNSNSNVLSSWTNTTENTGNHPWMIDYLPFLGVTSDGKNRIHSGDGELVINPKIDSDFSNPLDVFEGQFDAYQMNNFCQWLDDPSKVFVAGDSALNLRMEEKSSVIPLNNDGLLGDNCGGECLRDIISPIFDNSMSISQCTSGVEGNSVTTPRKGLFSELGLDHLLRDGASTSSDTKSSVDANNGAQIPHFGSLKEQYQTKQRKSWIDDHSHSMMDAKSCISGFTPPTRRPEESVKSAKKRARPGESSRPRPKDRQMIADRIKELRDLIPNGAKLSIDALLGRTVKHMLFLQNTTKHADKLKKLDESKLIIKENTSSISSGSNSSRDITWAYEVEGQNLFCPIIVEDLCHPGQMLIQMVCEERGYFLEIADVVRGLGLAIIKGVMESRDERVWAHYIVEGNRDVTRMDVFVSLMQFLEGSDTTNEATRTINNGGSIPPWSNYRQHRQSVPLPV